MWDFEHGTAGADFDISYTLPSSCATELQVGRADIGIIPAAAYTQIPDLAILPGVAIAARRAVRSILLVSKVPVEKIRTVALDTSSMTSVALTKVLFDRWLGGGRSFTPMAPDLDAMLRNHDAGLVIGDTALKVDRLNYLTIDLAEEWIRFTGKPFVFAFWAVRRAALANASRIWLRFFRRPAITDCGRKASRKLQLHGHRKSAFPRPTSAPISPRTFTTSSTLDASRDCSCSIATLLSAAPCLRRLRSSLWRLRTSQRSSARTENLRLLRHEGAAEYLLRSIRVANKFK